MPVARRILLLAALLAAVPVGAEAGIITIGPFVGSIPEPATSVLLGLGLGALALRRRTGRG